MRIDGGSQGVTIDMLSVVTTGDGGEGTKHIMVRHTEFDPGYSRQTSRRVQNRFGGRKRIRNDGAASIGVTVH